MDVLTNRLWFLFQTLRPSLLTPGSLSGPTAFPSQGYHYSSGQARSSRGLSWLSPVFAVKVNHKHNQVNSGPVHVGGQREGVGQVAEKQEGQDLKRGVATSQRLLTHRPLLRKELPQESSTEVGHNQFFPDKKITLLKMSFSPQDMVLCRPGAASNIQSS